MKRIIIFGVGRSYEMLKIRNAINFAEVVALCDNSQAMIGQELDGKPVISPDDLRKYPYDAIYITTDIYYNEIEKQLVNECHVEKNKIKRFSLATDKYEGELSYWKMNFERENHHFINSNYRNIMLQIVEEDDDEFWRDKVVVDFGCGPRGSLKWTSTPSVKIGVDVLAGRYTEAFGDDMIDHDMIYVTCSESTIPMPSAYADYLITINSMDHVDNLDKMTSELLRILKKNGTLIASFNLNEPSTECEPQTLTENILQDRLLKYFDVKKQKLIPHGEPNEDGTQQAYLQVCAVKK